MQSLFIRYLLCGLTMTLAALLVLPALPWLRKKASARSLYAALLLLMLGFLIPIRPAIPVAVPAYPSYAPVMPSPTAHTTSGQVYAYQTPSPYTYSENTPPVIHYEPAPAGLSASAVLLLLWCAGTAATLGYGILKHLRFQRIARRWSEPVTDIAVLALFEGEKSALRIRRKIAIRKCPLMTTPLLAGVLHPTVYLPEPPMQTQALSLVLRHELLHFKRGDLYAKALTLAAKALHWYNPVMYWLDRALSLQCEIACDAAVLRYENLHIRTQYAEAIVSVMRSQSALHTALSTGFRGGMEDMKKRLINLLDGSRKRLGIWVLCAVLLLTALGGIALASNQPLPTEPVEIDPNLSTMSPYSTLAPTITPIPTSAIAPMPSSLETYEAFGLTVEAETGRMLYEGKNVRMLNRSGKDVGKWIIWDTRGGDIDLYTRLNEQGRIIGIGRYDESEFDAHTPAWQQLPDPGNSQSKLHYANEAVLNNEQEKTDAANMLLAKDAIYMYMQCWNQANFDGMAAYALPSWQAQYANAATGLYWQHKDMIPSNWSIIPDSQSGNVITFTIPIKQALGPTNAHVKVDKTYTVRVVLEQGVWYVDPSSFAEDDTTPQSITPESTMAPSPIEQALTGFMQAWQRADYESMVAFTLPSWRGSVQQPAMQLYWTHDWYRLESYAYVLLETRSDRVIYQVAATVTKNNSSQQTESLIYEAVVSHEDGQWYVDPESMRTATVVESRVNEDVFFTLQTPAPTYEPTLAPPSP